MTNFKHLTQFELSAYQNHSLEKTELHEIGKQLLMCPDCRKRLPLPSVEKFWSAILTENEAEDDLTNKTSDMFSPFFAALSSFWNLYSSLIFGGAALIVFLAFSLLFWLNISNSKNDLVKTFDKNGESAPEINFPLPANTPDNNRRVTSPSSNLIIPSPTQKTLKRDFVKPKSSQNIPNENIFRKTLPENRDNVSSTRGGSGKCSEETAMKYELLASEENLLLKWKKIPNAAKYHLYISDDDEILIDEYETETETSFVLKKALDPLKTYKWKIIVTMENGETVVGTTNKFTVKDFQTKQIKLQKQKKTDVRCLANDEEK